MACISGIVPGNQGRLAGLRRYVVQSSLFCFLDFCTFRRVCLTISRYFFEPYSTYSQGNSIPPPGTQMPSGADPATPVKIPSVRCIYTSINMVLR